jgi:hypothetical protein
MTTTVYAVAAHRSFDNYFARFVGFGSLQEAQEAFPGVRDALAALQHNKTLTFRRPYTDHRTPDEIVVLRYDVPADADHLYVQFIRWKYAGLTMTATTGDKPEIPDDVNMLSDCVYSATWSRPLAPEPSTPPPSETKTPATIPV